LLKYIWSPGASQIELLIVWLHLSIECAPNPIGNYLPQLTAQFSSHSPMQNKSWKSWRHTKSNWIQTQKYFTLSKRQSALPATNKSTSICCNNIRNSLSYKQNRRQKQKTEGKLCNLQNAFEGSKLKLWEKNRNIQRQWTEMVSLDDRGAIGERAPMGDWRLEEIELN